ncbi:MAG: tRNA (adenosine(37)-N6)-threonylcarbamoyltransferase complex dimerization subunit type 1 TsaB [Bacteroidales bacterium]|nr:tRNA (adenosine(37)-N6)-threonylcarbamoyltransferase complex dimerization subunit type 1 TsaB [Bacteroidales bacterium]MCF8334359.1 tRNA (adenosine(37)-N6)-threonylcarbamoyltransferase complex dimerization subunit type 1 TsaB [Bacteroidales bacterium]
MALILNIETATPVLSVALAKDGEVIALREENTQNRHSERITLFIRELLEECQVSHEDLDAVAISEGPGSYTGLRIGTSTVKGICYAQDIPLIAISTLKAMAWRMAIRWKKENNKKDVLFCPMIDARRMEVYSAFFDSANHQIRKVQADIIDENSYENFLAEKTVVFGGDGAGKCKEVIRSENAVFLDNIHPSSEAMAPIAETYFSNKNLADVAYFEPFYLKAFKAGKPKVKGLYD